MEARFSHPERGPSKMIHPIAPKKLGMANVRVIKFRIVFLNGISVRATAHAEGMAMIMEKKTDINASLKVFVKISISCLSKKVFT